MSITAVDTSNNTIRAGATVAIDSLVMLTGQTTQSLLQPVTANWKLLDDDGASLLSGAAGSVNKVNLNATTARVRCQANFQLPADLPGEKTYFILWQVNLGSTLFTASESFFVDAVQQYELGLPDVVVLDPAKVKVQATVVAQPLRSPPPDSLWVRLYTPDNMLATDVELEGTLSTDGNTLFLDTRLPLDELWYLTDGVTPLLVTSPIFLTETTYRLTTDQVGFARAFLPGSSFQVKFLPTLDPYMLMWSWPDGAGGDDIGTSQLWVINQNISSAMHELSASLQRAGRYPGLLESALTNADMVQFLKMGRDHFNSLGIYSNFTMIGADGQMRRLWIACSMFWAAQSRKLEEAIKAFNFSGQSTSLEVDISGAYEGLMGEMQAFIEQNVPSYKRQLAQRGLLEGDGSTRAIMSSGRVPVAIGSTMSTVGNARFLYQGRYFGSVVGAYIGQDFLG